MVIYMRKSGMAKRRFCHAFSILDGEVKAMNEVTIETLSEQERKLIQIIRELGYGELTITVKGGKPVHVNELRKSIQLNG